MGFMDKVKQAAADVSAEAKKATAQGKEKLGQAQVRRKMDDAAKRLGYATWEKSKGSVTDEAAINSIIQEMNTLEVELNAIGEADAAAAGTPSVTDQAAATAAEAPITEMPATEAPPAEGTES
jgi:uncharacterized protein YcbX